MKSIREHVRASSILDFTLQAKSWTWTARSAAITSRPPGARGTWPAAGPERKTERRKQRQQRFLFFVLSEFRVFVIGCRKEQKPSVCVLCVSSCFLLSYKESRDKLPIDS